MNSEKKPMLAGLCWKPAATKSVTASSTGMYLPMIVRPMKAKKAAIPTSQLARTPESTRRHQPAAPPTSR